MTSNGICLMLVGAERADSTFLIKDSHVSSFVRKRCCRGAQCPHLSYIVGSHDLPFSLPQ